MYDHKKIERKWQKEWEKSGLYKTKDDKKKKKYYILDMFPYPSGAGLHVGHPKGYIATDVFARMKMMQKYNVLHPMGWDAFGLPAENYAIENKVHPRQAVEENIKKFKNQLLKLGFTYDWAREINTTDPGYYKWTQWIFLQMFKKGLAYESNEPVNWCPSCKTVLSNEDLEGGKCERCGSDIERKPMRQWVLKITDYADRMLNDLEKLPDWEESIKEMQRNWIGRSEGAIVQFSIFNFQFSIDVFTTRPDTLFGATYFVMSPEHPLVKKLTTPEQKKDVEEYIKKTAKKSELERTDLAKEKTGVFTGAYAINPVNQEKIPVWIADYVLMGYGTGAIMAVPGHDKRDFDFAREYEICIRCVTSPRSINDLVVKYRSVDDSALKPSSSTEKTKKLTGEAIAYWVDSKTPEDSFKRFRERVEDGIECYTGEGVNINSGFLDGLETEKAKEEMIEWLEKNKVGKKAVNYKLKDWVFSRQRYWGEPIPIIHCEKCGTVAVPEKDLSVKLPEVKSYEPTDTGESPLAKISKWVNVKCPKCGGPGKRETNTMPQWAGSSWYYLRYIDPENDQALVDKKKEKKWMPVDLYVGGAEHATRHLLYARFWHKFLFDIGAVSTSEPFKKLVHVGLIQAEDGRKMSKRWGNVINPDDVISKFGADAMRVYEMFMGPFTQNIAWSTNGVIGAYRFLEKVWKLNSKVQMTNDKSNPKSHAYQQTGKIQNNKSYILLNKTIKKVGEDIENFRFNTAVSALMILSNELEKQEEIPVENYASLLVLLSPFAPHIAEELWSNLGHEESIFRETWPKYDPKLVKDEEIELVIQINGKVKAKIIVSADNSQEEATGLIKNSERIKGYLEGK
ncbi:MAG: leucine--tRNA ligase, partial [Patescibacteria group bacterium]|nr:leucine--tRNA ligase [Patescibacteria group bacterium]